MPRVMVTNGSDRAALAVIRSLGKRGIDVLVGESFSFNAGALSRYCKTRILYPPPERSKTKFIKWLLQFVRKEDLDLLIPVNDFTAFPISEFKEDFEKFVKVALPVHEIAMRAFDKVQTAQIAAKCDIPMPKTFVLEEQKNIRRIASELNYPVVIKPRMKIVWVNDKAVVSKITSKNYAFSKEDLVHKYLKISTAMQNMGNRYALPFLQEQIEGTGFGVEALMSMQLPRALFAHKRLREYPITGGASTLRESVRAQKMTELGIRLLKAMEWTGMAMVEFKVDRKDNQPKLIEVNGRLWGSLALAISAGVDFPYLLYDVMVQGKKPYPTPYKIGIMKRWLVPGDILWFLSSIMSGENKISTIGEFLKSFAVRDDVISLSDPAPFFGAIADMLKDAMDVLRHHRSIEGETLLAETSALSRDAK